MLSKYRINEIFNASMLYLDDIWLIKNFIKAARKFLLGGNKNGKQSCCQYKSVQK